MLEENLAVPFATEILGTPVRVERVDLDDADEIVAVIGALRRAWAWSDNGSSVNGKGPNSSSIVPIVLTNELNNPVVGIVQGFNTQIATQFSTFPLGSSSGGMTYVFDESVGILRRGSASFGPSFAERALTIGRGKLSVGFNRRVRISGFAIASGRRSRSNSSSWKALGESGLPLPWRRSTRRPESNSYSPKITCTGAPEMSVS